MKILLVSDAWAPQVNGVVTTYTNLLKEITEQGISVDVIEPNDYTTVPLPRYPEINVAINPWEAKKRLQIRDYDAIHIATEGPLGIYARCWCVKNNVNFTTSYHTKFPEYLHKHFGIPVEKTQSTIRWFHKAAKKIFVTSAEMKKELEDMKITCEKVVWTRGIDTEIFNPNVRPSTEYDKPIYLYAGRVSKEKNLEAFLDLPLNGTKVVVGGGPQLKELEKKYPNVIFTGFRFGVGLASHYRAADVFVFPSKSDTFGLVMIEAMACGTPVAAFDVTGPKTIVEQGVNGYLSDDLLEACEKAIHLDREKVHETSQRWSWENSANIFIKNLEYLND